MNKNISIIVAISDNYGIGKENRLLWHLSGDLKRFKQITSGKTVVMGKNTYDSLPVKPLPKRKNIVITDNPDDVFPECIMVNSIEQAIEQMDSDNENFIMGGASIYKQFFGIADKLYVTRVFTCPEADTFFPEITDNDWELASSEEVLTDSNNGLRYQYLIYHRK